MYKRDDLLEHEKEMAAPESNGEGQMDLDLPTSDDRGNAMNGIPQVCSLEGLTEISPSLQGVQLKTLTRFDTIFVRTSNSTYRIFLLDPETGRALLEGGRQITEPAEALVIGSSFGGSILRTGWIGVGLRLEAWANDKYIRTSPVQSLCVERQASPSVVS